MENPAGGGSGCIDSWVDRRLHRPLSRRVTRALLRTPATATQVTLLSLSSGLAAGWCFGQGRPGWGVGGLGLFLLSAVLDHSDGELARATATESAFGHFLDNLSDGLVALAVVAGMSWAMARHLPDGDLALIAQVIAVGLPACFVTEWRLETLRAVVPLRDSRQRILFRIMNTMTSREPLYVFLLIYLLITINDGAWTWQALAWTFAGGLHLFWAVLLALGWRFFGLRAMIHGPAAVGNDDTASG